MLDYAHCSDWTRFFLPVRLPFKADGCIHGLRPSLRRVTPPLASGLVLLQHHGQRRWLGSAEKLLWRSFSSRCSFSGPWWDSGRWNPATASRTWPPVWTSSVRGPRGGGWTWKTWWCRRTSSTWAAATPRWSSPNRTETTAYSTMSTSSTTCGTAHPVWTTSTFTGIMCSYHTGTPRSQPVMPKEGTHLQKILHQVFTRSWGHTVQGTQRCWSHTWPR